jgi:hypothetical protein
MLKHEVMAADEWHDNGPSDLITGICAFKLPSINAHNHNNIDISKLLAHTTPSARYS